MKFDEEENIEEELAQSLANATPGYKWFQKFLRLCYYVPENEKIINSPNFEEPRMELLRYDVYNEENFSEAFIRPVMSLSKLFMKIMVKGNLYINDPTDLVNDKIQVLFVECDNFHVGGISCFSEITRLSHLTFSSDKKFLIESVQSGSQFASINLTCKKFYLPKIYNLQDINRLFYSGNASKPNMFPNLSENCIIVNPNNFIT